MTDLATCQLDDCANPVTRKPGRGRTPIYCSAKCRNRANTIRLRDSGKSRELSRQRYASGKRRRPCSLCGNPTGHGLHQGGENPVCRACRRARRGEPTCEQCGSSFTPKNIGQRFCDRDCFNAWQTKYPGDPRAHSKAAARRRRMVHAETWDGVVDGQIFERDNWVCLIPECVLPSRDINRTAPWPQPDSPSIDHIVPLSRGGSDRSPNKRAAHLRCNMIKGDDIVDTDLMPELAPIGIWPKPNRKKERPPKLCVACYETPVSRRGLTCSPCRLEANRERREQILRMRESGLLWREIASELGLRDPAAAYNIAHPYSYPKSQ